jgi:hypothetical protein
MHRGNIAITPRDGTMAQMLCHMHVIQEVLAHGQDPERVVFEEDGEWERFVVGGVPAEEVQFVFLDGVDEGRVREEIEQSHPALGGRIHLVRPLCRDEDVRKREQISFVIVIEGSGHSLKGGAYLFGRWCWVAKYHTHAQGAQEVEGDETGECRHRLPGMDGRGGDHREWQGKEGQSTPTYFSLSLFLYLLFFFSLYYLILSSHLVLRVPMLVV